MAEDLGETPNALRRARDAGRLPGPEHDRSIAIRARALGLRSINPESLAELRATRPEITLAERQEIIRRFVEAAGGYLAVAVQTGVTRKHLWTNRTRGYLNKSAKFEYLELAKSIGFELPPEIFTKPVG